MVFLVRMTRPYDEGGGTMQPAMRHAPIPPAGHGRRSPEKVADAVPFRSTEEAWLWTMAALAARRDGARYVAGAGKARRPCEPDDVVRSLDKLYRDRRVDLAHARVLRVWGDRQTAPNPVYPAERGDWRLWREALDRLDWPLRVKGIVS
jgi:hypothetical protein